MLRFDLVIVMGGKSTSGNQLSLQAFVNSEKATSTDTLLQLQYFSVAMLGGTAYSLSLSMGVASQSYLLYPLIAHFGWTSAATLVNLNGSIGSDKSISPRTVVAIGHSSAVIATALGVGITVSSGLPLYGLTVSWALAACSDGVTKRTATQCSEEEKMLSTAALVQKKLCLTGSVICALASVYVSL